MHNNFLKRGRRIYLAAALMLAAGEAIALLLKLFDGPWYEDTYRGFHLVQMIMAIAAALAFRKEIAQTVPPAGLNEKDAARVALLVPTGLVFSLMGDAINSAIVDLRFVLGPDIPQTLLSIPFFALAHLFYMIVFFSLARKTPPGGKAVSRIVQIGAAGLATAAVVLPLWYGLIPGQSPVLVRALTLFYALVVTMMMFSSLWVAYSWRRAGALVAAGGVLFWFSDALIGYFLSRPAWAFANGLIWTTYFTAQLLILRAPLILLQKPDSMD